METVRVAHVGYYLPKNYFRQDEFSTNLLRFKENRLSAKYYFVNHLKRRLNKLKGEFILCCVPTSKRNKENPMRRVIELLASYFPNFQNGVDLLYRKHDMPSLCQGGERDFYRIQESIGFDFIMQVWGKDFLLLDDIVTTGVSFAACASILKQYGARKVYPIALGKTRYKNGCPVGQPTKIML